MTTALLDPLRPDLDGRFDDVPPTVFDPGSARVYEQHRRRLLVQAVRRNGPLVNELFSRRSSRDATRVEPWRPVFGRVAVLAREAALRHVDYLSPADFEVVNGMTLPIIADRGILSKKTGDLASRAVAGLPQFEPWGSLVSDILANSRLDESRTPFRSIGSEAGPIVVGLDSDTVGALAAIAHELGHCIHERLFGRATATTQLGSEKLAHLLEEAAVATYLSQEDRADDLSAWRRYQRKLDAINYHFFEEENLRLFAGRPPDQTLFSPEATIYRESLFTLPGYQATYAYASATRAALHTTRTRP